MYDFHPDQLHLLNDPTPAEGDSARLGIEHKRLQLALPVIPLDGARLAAKHAGINLLDDGVPRAWVAVLRPDIPVFVHDLVDLWHWQHRWW